MFFYSLPPPKYEPLVVGITLSKMMYPYAQFGGGLGGA